MFMHPGISMSSLEKICAEFIFHLFNVFTWQAFDAAPHDTKSSKSGGPGSSIDFTNGGRDPRRIPFIQSMISFSGSHQSISLDSFKENESFLDYFWICELVFNTAFE